MAAVVLFALLVFVVFAALVAMSIAAGLFLGLCDWLNERY